MRKPEAKMNLFPINCLQRCRNSYGCRKQYNYQSEQKQVSGYYFYICECYILFWYLVMKTLSG